jgi:iron(III) transport system ATP-binding protein
MPSALAISGLCHSYLGGRRGRSSRVLSNVSFQVGEGELVSVLGRSGAGKTTLLRAVGGFLTPQQGEIVLDGTVVTSNGRTLVPTERRKLGIVFQDYALFGHMTVAQNVAFGVRGSTGARVAEMLDLVGLSELSARRPAELSGGQQQRVALARALAPEPKLLLLDEPFANLDATLRADLRDDLRQVLRRTGTAGLLITHDRHEALSIADRIAVLTEGPDGATLAQIGPPSEVYATPADLEVARLTGPTNVIEGVASSDVVTTPLGELPLRDAHTGPVQVMARPEELRFETGEGAATVVSRQFCGASTSIVVLDGDLRIRIDLPPSQAPDVGQRGRVTARGPLSAWSTH